MHITLINGIASLPRWGRGGSAAFLFKKPFFMVQAVVLCLLLSAGLVLADGKGKLTLKITTEKEIVVEDEKGKKKLKRVDLTKVNAIPGDEVILTLSYKNVGKEKTDGVVINYPIPEEMRYKGFSAEGKGTKITFSIDKGKTYDRPEKLTVIDMEGKVVPAMPKDYTHIRWTFGQAVAPGKKGKVGFRTFIK